MSLLSDLMQKPKNLSSASKFVSISGVFFMACGLSMLAWPGIDQMLFRDAPFAGNEEVLFRVIGFMLLVIGWLYFFGGRSNSRQFVAATVIYKIILTPLVLVPTALAGVVPHIALTFAILDPILAFIAWYLLSKSKH